MDISIVYNSRLVVNPVDVVPGNIIIIYMSTDQSSSRDEDPVMAGDIDG